MGGRFGAPAGLECWELDVDGVALVLFEWSAPAIEVEHLALTPAERDVLDGVVRGESNAEIARRRGSRPRTVANQLASLFGKLGVRSRLELVAKVVGR